MARLQELYRSEVRPQLAEELAIKNPMALPVLSKVVVSMGVPSPTVDRQRLGAVQKDLATITGQKPAMCRARRSVSNFKLREGMEIGCMVTLRGRRMYEFVDRLISIAIPRVRDFRGLSPRSFDGRGNYSMGVADQSIFPEIDLSKITYNQGMNITFVTSGQTDAEARALLTKLGMPLRRTGERTN